MRAARLTTPGEPLELCEVERTAPPAGWVELRVEAVGICRTDLLVADGLLPAKQLPLTLGHEIAGVVERAGDGADARPGERVGVTYFDACGACRPCRRGAGNICEEPRCALALSHDGGFAEYVLVPASALVRLPDGLDFVDAAPLCCSAATAMHAIEVAGVRPGDVALVIGCGGVGLALVQLLVLAGARVFATDVDPAKVEAAVALGAEAAPEGLEKAVDVAFDLAGGEDTGRRGINALSRGGRLVLVGLGLNPLTFYPAELITKERHVLSASSNTHAELERVVELAGRGLLHPEIHEVAPLEDVNRVLEDLREGRIVGRAVLVPGAS